MSGRDPWRDVSQLLVDGNNLLHRASGSADQGSLRLLLARLQGHVPPSVRIALVLDGAPDPGAPMHVQIRPGFTVRYSGRATADDALLDSIAGLPFAERGRAIVVTDDMELRRRARTSGGRTEPLAWLTARIEGPAPPPSGPGLGATRRRHAVPSAGAAPETTNDEAEREPWRPGRGATRKRGNPRRGHRATG